MIDIHKCKKTEGTMPKNKLHLILAWCEIHKLEDKINEPLKDINYFMTAKVHHHTVMWNEKLDICPEYLYEKSVKVK